MFKKTHLSLKLLTALSLSTLSFAANSASVCNNNTELLTCSNQLATPRTVISNTPNALGEQDMLDLYTNFGNDSKTGDLYVALKYKDGLLFYTGDLQHLSTTPTAYKTDQSYTGSERILKLSGGIMPAGMYDFYQVVAESGTDVLNPDNWIGGKQGLSILHFMVGMPDSIHADFNGDGFPDDDSNKDGFHDDDRDLDGYHDDDINFDYYHDKDMNRNGKMDD